MQILILVDRRSSKVRRSDRQIKDFKEIVEVIKKCDVCRIALNDAGYPYMIPLNFGMKTEEEQITLYFHGAGEFPKNVCIYAFIWLFTLKSLIRYIHIFILPSCDCIHGKKTKICINTAMVTSHTCFLFNPAPFFNITSGPPP